jgi:hypothetical protein
VVILSTVGISPDPISVDSLIFLQEWSKSRTANRAIEEKKNEKNLFTNLN